MTSEELITSKIYKDYIENTEEESRDLLKIVEKMKLLGVNPFQELTASTALINLVLIDKLVPVDDKQIKECVKVAVRSVCNSANISVPESFSTYDLGCLVTQLSDKIDVDANTPENTKMMLTASCMICIAAANEFHENFETVTEKGLEALISMANNTNKVLLDIVSRLQEITDN